MLDNKSYLDIFLSYLIVARSTILFPEGRLSLLHVHCRRRLGTVTLGMSFNCSSAWR